MSVTSSSPTRNNEDPSPHKTTVSSRITPTIKYSSKMPITSEDSSIRRNLSLKPTKMHCSAYKTNSKK
jgi:hypothetical protein